ncbi:MAG: histidine kinase [Bacteroidales bacterium]
MGLLFRYRIWWHAIFWVVWYFFYIFTYSSGVIEPIQLVQNLYLLPVRMVFTDLLIYWILPRFLLKRKFLLFTLLAVVHGILFGLAVWYVIYLVSGYPFIETLPFIRPIILNYQIPATAAAIYMFKRWYLIQQYTLNLEKEKIESELNFLKSQIHPHFLFNTLNNLYALTLKKSDSAPDTVLRLSNLLEYTLYSGKKTEVELGEELNQLLGYINLEKLRFGNRLTTSVNISSNTDGLEIAPLLLLPFVENSFKHGVSNDLKNPYIKLNVDVTGNQLVFNIVNSCSNNQIHFEVYKERIGLKNVKRRLELLYPDTHKLDIIQEDDTFTVNLELILSGNKNKQK